MPSSAVKLIPGVNTDKTPSLNEAGISSSNLIRFREGMIEKRGGWTKYLAAAVGAVPRALWAWRDFSGKTWLGVGSTNALAAIQGGAALDITPRQVLSTLQNCFSYKGQSSISNGTTTTTQAVIQVTDASHVPVAHESFFVQDLVSCGGVPLSGPYDIAAVFGSNNFNIVAPGYTGSSSSSQFSVPTYQTVAGSPTVTVSLTAHGVSAGYQYGIVNPVTVGGLTLTGSQVVASVIDTNTFTIQASGPATATASQLANSGNVTIRYVPRQTYGTAKTGTAVPTADWSLGNYGKLLIACAVGGNINSWDTTGNASVAAPIQGAPQASGIVISDAAQQIIAYGGNPNSLYDPNYVAWSDTGNLIQWTAAIGNQAGSYRIPSGSAIIGAATVAATLILLWTDVDVWAMQYVNYPTVYGFTKLATGCGLISQFAWARMGGSTLR